MDLLILPTIFYIWSGILLSWGAFCFYRMLMIRRALLDVGSTPRKTDIYICFAVGIFECILAFSIFYAPFPHNMIEIVLTLSFWYTILLTYTQQLTSKFISRLP